MRLKAVALLLTLALGLLAAPVTAEGQKAGKVYRVGTLFPPAIHKTFRIEAFREGKVKNFNVTVRAEGLTQSEYINVENKLRNYEENYRAFKNKVSSLKKYLIESPVSCCCRYGISGWE